MNANAHTAADACIAHETAQRVRLKVPPSVSLTDLRVQLERLPGVTSVGVTRPIRSVTVRHDGRRPSRTAILSVLERELHAPRHVAAGRTRRQPRERGTAALAPILPALATAALPLAPAGARPVVALGALAARTLTRPPEERRTAAFLLDTLSLATTALTGHPIATTTSILLGSVAERWRDDLLEDADRLLEHLTPPLDAEYLTARDGASMRLVADALRTGDVVELESGHVVPADALVRSGRARIAPRTHSEAPEGREVSRGRRLASGERLSSGALRCVVERPASHSQGRRMREHVRHTLRTRDTPGGLTPDLERLAALPITAAGLVLAITGDAGRTAAMLQADPQHGLLLSHPVAREAALYALAREGLLGRGLETVERLATATVLAVEDIRILTERSWQVAEVRSPGGRLTQGTARQWLAQLAGIESVDAANAGFRDRQVSDWLEHGAVLHDPPRTLHVAGAEPLRRTWGLQLAHADRGSLERVLGIAADGGLVGSVKLRVALRQNVAAQLQQLRLLGFRRIAILTEDLEESPGPELAALGADALISSSRAAQGRWLEKAVEDGERVALLHTGLRDLLPPGGLSLCPAEAEAGAHAVLIGEPLRSLLAARSVAQSLHRELRRQFGATMTVNAALMVASGLRLIPPIVNTTLHHAATLALLRSSMGLAETTHAEDS
jgi:cation-transporting P-type ATPase C